MSSMSGGLAAHKANVRKALRDVFVASTDEVQRSLTEGSQLTGAPGQPVQTGQLRGSFVPGSLGPWAWQSVTNLVYAPPIEEGIQQPYDTLGSGGSSGKLVTPKPMQLRSQVGGFHSVKLTRIAWPRIVDVMAERHAAGAGVRVRG